MFSKSSKLFWKRQLKVLLAFVVVASSFPAVFAPQPVSAAGVVPAPGGVDTGLISWIDAEKSIDEAGQAAGKSDKLIDQRGNRTWTGTGQYLTSAFNFNGGIEFPGSGLYQIGQFNQDDNMREIFSVQASNGVKKTASFPWEFGAGITENNTIYWPTIRTAFGRESTLDISVDEDLLKNAAIMNIWSAPDDWSLSLNGAEKRHEPTNTPNFFSRTTGQSRYYIGAGHNSIFNGRISEVILYNRKLEDYERQKVNSYLALKYGLTLKNENGQPMDYIASDSTNGTDGTKMWTATKNVGYGNRITGIGLDETGNLNQKQSKSQETGAIVTIALGNEITTANKDVQSEIVNDRSFFVFSDDNGSAEYNQAVSTTDVPGDLQRMQRNFKVEKTNWADAEITLQIPDVDEDYCYYLLINETTAKALDVSGQVTLSTGELADGATFTFARALKIPLAAPNVKLDVHELTWEPVEHADKYEVTITLNDNTVKIVEVLDGKTTLDLTTLGLAPDTYKLTVIAKSSDLAYSESEVSNEVDYKAVPKLERPDNVTVNGDQLTWDAVTDADGYEVTIKHSDGTISKVPVPNGTELDLSKIEPALVPGTYSVTVTAKSDNPAEYTDSEASDAVEYTVDQMQLKKPTAQLQDNKLTWEAVNYADKYEVTVKSKDGVVITTETVEGTEFDLLTLGLAPGTYEVTLTAKSNTPDVYTDSEASDVVEFTAPEGVDKTALRNKINEAKSLTPSDYTQASWTNQERVLEEANRVLKDPNATQADVDQALDKLQKALDNLVVLNGELEELNLAGLNNDGNQAITLNPAFDPNQYKTYQGTVANDVYGISLNPKAKYPDDNQVKVFVNGKEYPVDQWDNLPLEEGVDNVVKVGVYSKTGQLINEYTYTIFRESAVPADNKLESLVPSVGSLSPAFDPNQDTYTMNVSNSVYQIQLTPTAVDPNATIQIRVNNGEWKEVASGQISDDLALNVGLNNIVVKVTGKDGSSKEYTVKVTREYSSDNGGGSTGNTGGTTTPSTPDNTEKPGSIVTTDNGSNVSFASGTVNGNQAMVTIDKNKLSGILADGKGHKLGIRVPGNSDVEVRGLTLEDLKKLADTGSSLEIEDVLAIYPVPAGQLDVNAISKQFGNALISDIAANIKIKRSADDLAKLASEKAAEGGYELLVHPVDLDLTFNHDGKTDRAGLLNGYAPKYIALPEGIDPNRITTGVIVNPDGSVYHVPTVVTKVNNRYFALINDLRSSGTYSVIWNPQDFEDVQYHWGRADVNNIAARLDLKGNGDNTFSPNRHVTRSEFAEIVVLGLGLMRQDAPQNIYPDVPSTAWYRNAVALADEFDIVRGYTDGSFKGSQQITREQGFAMIARAYRLIQSENVPSPEQIASTLAPYADGDKVASWAKGDVAQLIAAEIIQGNGPDHLSPKAQMTRAEVTALIARMLKVTNLIDK
ncbi:S-layer homology domain-containing protein [Paenibacillus ihbetae]|nr:S-layer homology domain-containing protein [Paenibacillus ihbetae]